MANKKKMTIAQAREMTTKRNQIFFNPNSNKKDILFISFFSDFPDRDDVSGDVIEENNNIALYGVTIDKKDDDKQTIKSIYYYLIKFNNGFFIKKTFNEALEIIEAIKMTSIDRLSYATEEANDDRTN